MKYIGKRTIPLFLFLVLIFGLTVSASARASDYFSDILS